MFPFHKVSVYRQKRRDPPYPKGLHCALFVHTGGCPTIQITEGCVGTREVRRMRRLCQTSPKVVGQVIEMRAMVNDDKWRYVHVNTIGMI